MNLSRIMRLEIRWPKRGEAWPCPLCHEPVVFLGRKRGKGTWEAHTCPWPRMTIKERKAKGLYFG